MLSRLIYKKSFWCEMSYWWEALKWQQWSLRHRDYVVWEHISNWWVKGILIIFKPSDSFSVQNLSPIYFFPLLCDRSSTAQGLPPPTLLCPLPQNSCHKYFVIYSKGNKQSFLKHGVCSFCICHIIYNAFCRQWVNMNTVKSIKWFLTTGSNNPVESCLLANENQD